MRLWHKFCDSHVKFTRNSYEIRTNFGRILYEFHIFRIFTHFYSREIRTKFVRNSHEIRTNFVRISYEFRANLCEFLQIACESQLRELFAGRGW